MTTETITGAAWVMPEPVAANARFVDDAWFFCGLAHHAWVQQNPEPWRKDGYETRALYTAEQVQAAFDAGQAAERAHTAQKLEELQKRIQALPRYSFMLLGGGVRKVADKAGSWVELDGVNVLVDDACATARVRQKIGGE